MIDTLAPKLEVSLITRKIAGGIKFFLAGAVPADVTWSDGKVERIEVAQAVACEPFSRGRILMGSRKAYAEVTSLLPEGLGQKLLEKLEAGITKAQTDKKLGDKTFEKLDIVR